jgi:hypothetical protein
VIYFAFVLIFSSEVGNEEVVAIVTVNFAEDIQG